jgi:CRISPR-associated protein Csb2
MSLTIAIRFLTGRAHLHPWQTHHSEGRVEWPPSQWRLLRSLVAVAGRGLTSLPYFDVIPTPKREPVLSALDISKPSERGVPPEARKKLAFSKATLSLALREPLTDAEANAWKAANPGESFATALDRLRRLAAASEPVALADEDSDEISLSRLAELLHALSATPTIWLPKTGGGHARQYFPIHEAGIVKNTGSAVFDTFATVRKDQPLCFHWSELRLDEQEHVDLRLLIGRMTYFGRAESWCRAEVHTSAIEEIRSQGVSPIAPEKTHWQCLSIDEGGKPAGSEYREYLLERRLAPTRDLTAEAVELLPRTIKSDGRNRTAAETESLRACLKAEPEEKLLLRCLLRESGQDMKDGLERPVGTRWVHYAVPRAIYDVPRPRPRARTRASGSVDLVRYALNTATAHLPVLPALTDVLLVAGKFRSAVMALCSESGVGVCGREDDGSPCKDHQHAFWWPLDEDNDGFIDHVVVYCPAGFSSMEVDALRRLNRLRQRGGRPDLLVTPVFIGQSGNYLPWRERDDRLGDQRTTVFASATPYFCPVHRSHGRRGGPKRRPITPVVREGLKQQGILDELETIQEIVFDYSPSELASTLEALVAGKATQPVPPRQYFPAVVPPTAFPGLPTLERLDDDRFHGASLKNPDAGYPFGLSVGLLVDRGTRLVRALSFCRRRRNLEVRGYGRMLLIRFRRPRAPRPFALGAQCHFGLGLFAPSTPAVAATDGHSSN